MKTRTVDTITTNEELVRLRIYDGDLQIPEAAGELLRLEREQNAALRRRVAEALELAQDTLQLLKERGSLFEQSLALLRKSREGR